MLQESSNWATGSSSLLRPLALLLCPAPDHGGRRSRGICPAVPVHIASAMRVLPMQTATATRCHCCTKAPLRRATHQAVHAVVPLQRGCVQALKVNLGKGGKRAAPLHQGWQEGSAVASRMGLCQERQGRNMSALNMRYGKPKRAGRWCPWRLGSVPQMLAERVRPGGEALRTVRCPLPSSIASALGGWC